MATETDKVEVQRQIASFYRFGGIPEPANLDINDNVAAVFGTMLSEARKCSRAFGWVPTPPGGRATVAWLAMQLGRGVFDSLRAQFSQTCVKGVIYKWGHALQEASYGISASRLPLWA